MRALARAAGRWVEAARRRSSAPWLLALLGAAIATPLTAHAQDCAKHASVWVTEAELCLSPHEGSLPSSKLDGVSVVVPDYAAGPLLLRSQYWHLEVEARATYDARVDIDLPGWEPLQVTLAFVRWNGAEIERMPLAPPANGDGLRTYTADDITAPPGAVHAKVLITSEHHRDAYRVEGVTLDQTTDPPTSTPSPGPTPAPTSEPSPTSTAGPTTTPSPTAPPSTSTPAPSATPGPGPQLRNADFRGGLSSWEVLRGSASTSGGAAWLEASGSTTMYIQQAVTVSPGGWYEARAFLTPTGDVDAGWVRIAWYASPDASGSQLSVADSPTTATVADYLSTGPVQAPAEARSARVRVLLRPSVPGASMFVSEVAWNTTSEPPATPTPAATPPGATPPPAAGSPATPAPPGQSPPPAGGPTTPPPAFTPPPGPPPGAEPRVPGTDATTPPGGPGAGAATPPVVTTPPTGSPSPGATEPPSVEPPALDPEEAAALSGPQQWFRMTELLPNSVQPGIDAEYEWVEITNLGAEPASTRGMRLIDNREATPLDEFMIGPGESLVVAGPLADTGAAPLVYRVELIGNGLSNTGDRLALLAADGTVVDALSYGEDTTFADPEHPIAAPGAGESIVRRFSSDGALLAVVFSDEPAPGFVRDDAAPGDDAEGEEYVDITDRGEAEPGSLAAAGTTGGTGLPGVATEHTQIWMALLLMAGGITCGLIAYRVAVIARDGDAVPSEASAGDTSSADTHAGDHERPGPPSAPPPPDR